MYVYNFCFGGGWDGVQQRTNRKDGTMVGKASGRLAVDGLLRMDGASPLWSCCRAFGAGALFFTGRLDSGGLLKVDGASPVWSDCPTFPTRGFLSDV